MPTCRSLSAGPGIAAALAGLAMLGGCAGTATSAPPARADAGLVRPADIYADFPNGPAPQVVRTGRYQLLTLTPTSGQRHLLQQMVSIDLPQSMPLTVRQGLVHVLRGSGLRLCARDAQTGFFLTPLPLVQRELGPTTLSDALQVLAGPAWRLQVDYAARTVCFAPRDRTTGAQPMRAQRDSTA